MIQDNKITKWHNCYESGWKDIITPESFQHPAKMSYSLLKRILHHAKEQGWLKEGDVIVDPFGGIGSTGILGAYEGYRVICVELEAKFVKLAEQNFELHKDAWIEFGNPRPIIIQGDSRQLCQIVEKADCIVSSPPFLETLNDAKMKVPHDSSGRFTTDYGQTPGQLGAMKPGKVDCILSSPPYAEQQEGGGISAAMRGKSNYPSKLKGTIGQKNQGYASQSNNPGNLGNLKSGDVDCVISSPPFEKTTSDKPSKNIISGGLRMGKSSMGNGYGESTGQLGQEQGDTFWSAAKTILEQCHQILKPGGHAIWVVKSFVRKGKLVDFPGDWQRLCESVGFKTVCVHHAMLVKEEATESLFGDVLLNFKEDKSFFRRLLETKYAYNKYWQTLSKKQKADFLRAGKKDCWDSYNSWSDEEKAEMLDDGIPKHPKPNKRTILSNAKCIAFIASGHNTRDWNEEIRIDFEVVLCMETKK